MSLALYRKYRPATFAELKGQEHVAEPLQQALRNGRINHAYLFSGPRGCGKTSSARILARSLNCEKGPTPDPCGVCDSCVALGPSGSGHIDVIEIDAASHGGVDDARDLRERAFFAPVASRFKIYIIDEAHMVTREGFNALLKLVEEPPPHLKFVFATTEPEKVIGTIRSRTHHYPFRLIPPGVLRDLLVEILDSESVPYEPNALPLVVRAGAGSARDSLSILDQLLAGADDAGITYARAVALLGYTDSSLLDEVVDAFAARDGGAVFAAVDRVIESGQDPRRFAADLLTRFRDLVILSNVPDAGTNGLLDQPADELERMTRQSAVFGRAQLTRAADLLHTGLTEMRGATSPRLLLELICARILLPGAYEDEASVLTRLERLERGLTLGGGPAIQQTTPEPQRPVAAAPTITPSAPERSVEDSPAQSPPAATAVRTQSAPSRQAAGQSNGSDWPELARPEPVRSESAWPEPARPQRTASPAAAPEAFAARPASAASAAPAYSGGLDVAAVRRSWPEILEKVKHKSRVAWHLMAGVQVASLEGNQLTLAFDNEGNRKGFTSGGRDAVVREAIKELLAADWRIDAVPAGAVVSSSPANYASAAAPAFAPPTAAASATASARPTASASASVSAPGPAPGPTAVPGAAPAAPPAASMQPAGPARSASTQSTGPAGPASTAHPADPAMAPAGQAPASAVPTAPPPPAPVPQPMEPPPPPPDEPPPFDEVDPESDLDTGAGEAMSGMALITREFGGQVIKEIDNP